MSRLRLSRTDTGALVVAGMPLSLARVLRAMPRLLGADQPEVVRRRLYPDASDDPEIAAEWRRTQHPELFALLADAKTIVENDLPTLVKRPRAKSWRIEIPAAHIPAWISALNAARLALGALYDVTAADMQPDVAVAPDARGIAILAIDLYGWLQVRLIRARPPRK